MIHVAVMAAGLFTFSANPSFASGSYTSRPATPKARTVQVERARYDLGQKVFKGQTARGQGDAAAQKPRLEALQRHLPASVAKKKDLPALAGTLTEEQLGALEYYVAERYPAK